MLVIMWAINLVRKVLCFMVWVAMAAILTFGVVLWLSNGHLLGTMKSGALERDIISEEQLYYFGTLVEHVKTVLRKYIGW
jgi:hypothetical protein